MTDRDLKVIEFVSKNPCRSDLIEKLFYPSYRVAMRRLQKIVDYGYLKRYRDSPNEKYFYYSGKMPRQFEHLNLSVKTILYAKSLGYEVVEFRREVKLDNIRPDAVIGLKKNNKYGVLLVEVERFNNSLKKKLTKYEQIYKDKKYFSKFKILYISNYTITSQVIDIINIKFDVINSL
ncbi:MAG: hypothetical protein ACI3T9_02295 [Romboutsia timonensis]